MKSYETDGKEYFFVSRQTMENFIQKRKFIEFGEYKGCLYGTSKDSIKRALKTGKTCVLKVQPEASCHSVIRSRRRLACEERASKLSFGFSPTCGGAANASREGIGTPFPIPLRRRRSLSRLCRSCARPQKRAFSQASRRQGRSQVFFRGTHNLPNSVGNNCHPPPPPVNAP